MTGSADGRTAGPGPSTGPLAGTGSLMAATGTPPRRTRSGRARAQRTIHYTRTGGTRRPDSGPAGTGGEGGEDAVFAGGDDLRLATTAGERTTRRRGRAGRSRPRGRRTRGDAGPRLRERARPARMHTGISGRRRRGAGRPWPRGDRETADETGALALTRSLSAEPVRARGAASSPHRAPRQPRSSLPNPHSGEHAPAGRTRRALPLGGPAPPTQRPLPWARGPPGPGGHLTPPAPADRPPGPPAGRLCR